MKVLVIGGGGREHAIVHAVSRSPKVEKIFAAPGNAGIAALAECVAIKDTDVDALVTFAYNNKIDLTIVGPEASLALGIVDAFEAHGLKIFGPKKAAAQVAASAAFSEKLDGMIKTGRMSQGLKESLVTLFNALQQMPLDSEGCFFSEGGEKVNPIQALNKALDSLPQVVAFGEFAHGEPPKVDPGVKISKYREEQLAKGRNITFAEAAEEAFK